jgi:hypothetical protein
MRSRFDVVLTALMTAELMVNEYQNCGEKVEGEVKIGGKFF